ncbi:hypothetical protein DZA65_00249 [Dickeya dianthicola]|uniref:DUF1481 domain-containing protein n=1 Tax=Dickeya dianthicola TaxID=204039 RepID=A0AAP6RZB0_9GAMM|nr:DUF1481 domain-containing protein [Dickeya dianthicola]AYC17168.1 hypothetical protein DZA65_00249 [Dickeya dianthicola]MBI0439331.1 DUF1481 domain-containing protein [Dickeya dianthicola]MBI0450996.1 DUF1481 domain-containing protein [Dickeya dianthicola]MBI0455456.1 DUF1481 domain-containing protein [Dickeya dianthicola]MBI0458376.1 DUF1481 domain-containing protein [Dickeya dianthicola]
MLIQGLSRGAISPLLLFFRRYIRFAAPALVCWLSACSSSTPSSAVYASGYLADSGVVRLWRKDDTQQHLTTLVTALSPLQGQDARITRYRFQQGALREVQQTYSASAHESASAREEIRLRFDQAGTVSYMQRQLPDRRESLSEDEIALYQFDARRLLALSDSLRAGKVSLMQGRWNAGQVTTCDGQTVRPDLDRASLAWIAQRAERTAEPLNAAWLVSPEGTQLLQVAEADFCRWEPTAEAW